MSTQSTVSGVCKEWATQSPMPAATFLRQLKYVNFRSSPSWQTLPSDDPRGRKLSETTPGCIMYNDEPVSLL